MEITKVETILTLKINTDDLQRIQLATKSYLKSMRFECEKDSSLSKEHLKDYEDFVEKITKLPYPLF